MNTFLTIYETLSIQKKYNCNGLSMIKVFIGLLWYLYYTYQIFQFKLSRTITVLCSIV